MRIYEECANCLKELVFCSERSRQLAINEYDGELLCPLCKAEVEGDD